MCSSLMRAKSAAGGQGILQPTHRLQLSKGILTHSEEIPEHPAVTISGNHLCPFQE